MNKNRSLSLGLALLMPASFLMADNCSSNCDSGVSSSCDTSASCDTSCSTGCSTSCSTGCSTSCDSSNSCTNPCGSCVTTYIPRAQNADTVFWEFFSDQSGHKADQDCFYGGLQLNVQYQQSFRGHDIARTLFGKSTLVFEGSNYYGSDRTAGALIADNFGLGPDFKGTMTLNPRIRNVNVNFGGYFGFDEWVQGLWLSSSFTFAHQSRDLNACFTTPTYGEGQTAANFPAGYVSTTEATGAKTIKEALSGDFTFGDMQNKWKFGRFSFCDLTTNKVAAVDFNFGYDFWNCEDYHFGAFLRVSAPTGTKIDASYARNVFAPVVGNGHHVEVGGGITGRWQLWNCDEDQSLTAYLDGYVTHLFSNCQVRSFDLKTTNSHCLSRYMLLKELTANDDEAIGYDYAGNLINAINWATRNTDVSVSVKGDATLRLIYRHNNWDLGFGYNIYGHSRDSLCVKTKNSPCSAVDTTKAYGIMSNEGNYYAAELTPPFTFSADQKLNSTATTGAGNTPEVGANIYNAWTDSEGTPIVDNATPAGSANWFGAQPAYGSGPAVALDVTTALDINSGKSPAQLIQKGFLTTNYTWKDCDWTPYLGAGVEVEGGSKFYHLKQWGVTLRGGFSF